MQAGRFWWRCVGAVSSRTDCSPGVCPTGRRGALHAQSAAFFQELTMPTRRTAARLSLAAVAIAAAALTGCTVLDRQSNLVAFTTQLRGANEVPANASTGSGSVDAVFDKNTNLFRWKVNYTGLTGPATAGHFHGPAAIGTNAGVALPWAGPMRSPLDG